MVDELVGGVGRVGAAVRVAGAHEENGRQGRVLVDGEEKIWVQREDVRDDAAYAVRGPGV